MSIQESNPTAALPEREPTAFAKGWGFLQLLLQPRCARKLGTLVTHGYLARSGWVRSVRRRPGLIEAEHPLPWATFPFIAFIAARLRPEWRIFEYGAGSSTLYYARRVRAVVAVEHDEGFAAGLAPLLPANVTLLREARQTENYIRAIERDGGEFDLVVVDGRDRVRCTAAALRRLHRSGAVILDDAERPEYAPAAALLAAAGFRRLDFWGLAPGVVGEKSTAVFYRTENCLGL